MKRRTTTTPVAVYRYGLRAPVENAGLVYDQMRKAHRYQNLLARIEQAKRLAVTEVQMRCGDLAAVESELSALYESTKDDKAARKLAKEQLDDLKAVRKEIKLRLRTDPDTLAAYAGINDQRKVLVKAARAECGVYWGTYELAEKAIEESSKKPEGCRTHAWRGRGRIGTRDKGPEGVDPEDFDSTHRLIQIINQRCETRKSASRLPVSSRPDNRFQTLRMRIGSVGRDPVFATWPMLVHRPFPPNTRVKNAYVTMTEVSPSKTDWSVCFTIESEALAPAVVHRGMGTVAVNLGWRKCAAGLRVATWVDDRGASGEVLLPAHVIGHAEKAESLRSIRDRQFADAVSVLRAFSCDVMPEWLSDARRWAHAWKSPSRLVRMVELWRGRRFAGDAALYEAMEAWRKQERHLHDWEVGARDRSVRQRDQIYRETALSLARGYSTVLIGDENLSALAEKVKDGPVKEVSANRFSAAPGVLRSEIQSCGRKHGAEVVKVSSRDVTRECSSCGKLCEVDGMRRDDHKCEHCGSSWSLGVNACRNMLSRHSLGSDGGGLAEAAE